MAKEQGGWDWPAPSLTRRLENYRLVHRRPVAGEPGGLERSRHKGGSVEFADYRDYVPGDEPRRIDWKAYARLRRLYIRELVEDRRDVALLLLDTSASMDWGGEAHKGNYALGLACGLGVCALAGQELVAAAVTAPAGVWLPPVGGPRGLGQLRRFLGEIHWGGAAGPAAVLATALALGSRVHSVYLLSDLWDLTGLEGLLRQAASRSLETTVLHVLSPEEWQPRGEGEWTLVDAESGEQLQVSLTPAVQADYRDRLAEYLGQLSSCCRRWGARYLALNSGDSLQQTLLTGLPRSGVLRPR